MNRNWPRVSAACLAVTLLAGCGEDNDDRNSERDSASPSPNAVAESLRANERARLVDVADRVGLNFTHDNGMGGDLYFIEPVGSGAALVDFDNDGDLDVLLVQGQTLPAAGSTASEPAESADAMLRSRVFRNELVRADGTRGELHFIDVTESSGLRATGYGMGVAAGDIDNDGRIDVYLTNFGANQLWRNVSDAAGIRFEDVTERSGTGDSRWSTSASLADLNGDGLLDLYVANYVNFRFENHKTCRTPGGRPNYCGPQSYQGEPDAVFLNKGGLRFEEISGPAGILGSPSSGLGVVTADFDRDGHLDIYVANDLQPNFLWRNLGGDAPRFEDTALLSGSAVAMDGRAQASMGLVAGDIDNDGDDDLFMTHLRTDSNTLYLNDGSAGFLDASFTSGLGAPSLAVTGFGTVLIDLDNDSWLDIVVANGAVAIIEEQAAQGSDYPLAETNLVFYNTGGGDYVDITESAGGELTRLEVSRGLAVGDVDNDGRSDILLSNNNGPARLLMNRTRTDHHWLGLKLLTEGGMRDALGAQVTVSLPDGRQLSRRAATDGSYLSASDARVLFGLGGAGEPVSVEVRWPGGDSERWQALPPDRYHVLEAGTGSPAESAAQ